MLQEYRHYCGGPVFPELRADLGGTMLVFPQLSDLVLNAPDPDRHLPSKVPEGTMTQIEFKSGVRSRPP